MNEQAVKEIADLAQGAFGMEVRHEAGARFVGVPLGGGKVEVRSLKPIIDEFRAAPERRAGTAKVSTLQSFIDLTNRHKDLDSAIFASIESVSPKLLAVIDYHTLDHNARFGKHRVEYTFPISDEWQAWRAKNGASMSQVEFASFIEDRVAELASPLDAERSAYEPVFGTKFAVPSELMQLSRGLAMNVESSVKEIRVLQTGEAQITYDEVHKDGSGQPLIVPGLFVISLPLFVGADPTRLIARLRYRRDGGIKWSFHPWRWTETIRAALENDLATVAKETALPAFEGTPEA